MKPHLKCGLQYSASTLVFIPDDTLMPQALRTGVHAAGQQAGLPQERTLTTWVTGVAKVTVNVIHWFTHLFIFKFVFNH